MIVMGWFSLLCWWHRTIALDDAWITFRYARNLVEGNGFVFNPGERLEGYSNFTWVLASAIAIMGSVEPFGFARVISWLGVAAGLGALCLGCGRAQGPGPDARVVLESETGESIIPGGSATVAPFRSATAAMLLAGSYPLAVWTMAGLETAVYTMLLLFYLLSLRGLLGAPSVGRGAMAGLVALLLALTRPEGAVWAMMIPVLVPFLRREDRIYGVGLPLVVFAAGYLVYTAWRVQTFGALVPNTVEAKVGGGAGAALARGAGYWLAYFAGPPGLMVVLAAVAAHRARVADALTRGFTLLCAGAVVVQTFFAVAVGGDWMPAARFFVPLLPPLCILVAMAIKPWPLFVRAVIVAFFVAAGFMQARHDGMLRWCRWAGKQMGGQLIVAPQVEVGSFLRANASESQTLAATEAGVVPYVSRLRFIDMLGLVDAHIASLPGGLHEKFDASYVLSREPDYILLGFVETPDGLKAKWEPDADMRALDEFGAQYKEWRRWPRPMDGPHFGMADGWMILYRRTPTD